MLTVCCVKIWAYSAILCVNRMRPESNAPLVAVTLTEFVCGLNRMRTRSIRHFWIVFFLLFPNTITYLYHLPSFIHSPSSTIFPSHPTYNLSRSCSCLSTTVTITPIILLAYYLRVHVYSHIENNPASSSFTSPLSSLPLHVRIHVHLRPALSACCSHSRLRRSFSLLT